MKKINVLSLFDGISCGQQALKKLKIPVAKYYASEIHAPSIRVAHKNFPNMIHLGDVTKVKASRLEKIDLLFAGSPCQGFSMSGSRTNFEHHESKLFFDFLRVLKECRKKNPKLKFLLENVIMKQEWMDLITKYVGVEPIKINSRLVSAQNRPRVYWTNIEGVKQPKDRKIFLRHILDKSLPAVDVPKKRLASDWSNFNGMGLIIPLDGKTRTLMSQSHGHGPKVATSWKSYRLLTVKELERLQGLPDDYTKGISKNQRVLALGNGWQVDTIAHILKSYKK